MWEHRGCLESVQQDAIWKCGLLEYHTWRIMHGHGKEALKHFKQMLDICMKKV